MSTANKTGPAFWKSLEEHGGTPEFRQWLDREFPVLASEWDDPEGRRHFMKLMGASLALAGLTGCTRQPDEKIVPYVKAPEEMVPGKPLHYATAVRLGGYAKGVLVETHEGRPTKVEGNPEHPASLGATDVFGQAEILCLYDPDRSQTLKLRGEIRAWSAFVDAMRQVLDQERPSRGAGIRILTETVTSPTLAAEIEALKRELPELRWHVWEPAGRETSRGGARRAFGEPVDARYKLDKADVILSLDADFIGSGPAVLADIRAFSARRKPTGPTTAPLNRLYAIETTPSLTGAKADHRLPLRPSEVVAFARALAAALELPVEAEKPSRERAAWIAAVAKDLRKNAGACVVMAGESQPEIVHVLAHAMNEALDNVGRTVFYTDPVETAPAAGGSLVELVADMNAGHVSVLLVLGGNPVYTAPADLDLRQALGRVPTRVHLGLYEDETAEECHWHVPAAHDFETWGDARAFDGTVTIQQALIEPLYGGKSPLEVLATLSGRPQRTAHEIVREHWKARWTGGDFEQGWRRALHDGVVPDTALPPRSMVVRKDAMSQPLGAKMPGLELSFRPDPSVHDGRYANNGWLQELPKPLTKLTWDNAVHLSVKTAKELGVATGDLVRLACNGRTLPSESHPSPVPVLIVPGQADGAATVHLGYGRRRAGRVGQGAGFDAYRLRAADRAWSTRGLTIEKAGGRMTLAFTQDHWSMEGRDIIRVQTAHQYEDTEAGAEAKGHGGHHDPGPEQSLYPPHAYEGHAWGMSIDLSACVGCNACITGCQSENNIPVVGKDQVSRGREMHWLRVDRYFSGDPEKAETISAQFAPVPCMHCENAPCEVVCPVGATVHSDEGLNDMVYNRCVGTKYCSNNCPYKVRRFNFLQYEDWSTPSLKLLRNPDVTVRSRGVMEKCTYCVQRINQARITARNEDRPIKDGDIKTACQQACPAQAIVFGDINDKASEVSRAKAEPRSYGMLTELGTRPRTTYRAALRNPNPEIPVPASEAEHHS
jgi:MoCo/4Fe-4S cofactor protein with predicted Tat translocation signal